MRRIMAVLGLFGLLVTACNPAAVDEPGTTTIPVDRPTIVGSAFQTFSNCDDLLDYYISHAVDVVGPWGLGGQWYWPMTDVLAVEEAASDGAGAPGSGGDRSFTETNNQVAGVDEIDVVKTDGDRIYSVVDGTLRIAVVGHPGITIAGRLSLNDWWPQGILLEGDSLLLVGQSWGSVTPLASDVRIAPEHSTPVTRIVQVDVSDPANPRIVRTLEADGSFVSARNVDGSVRLAINSNPVGLEWSVPQGGGLRSERQATERNREIIRNSTLDNWLPYYILTEADGTTREGLLVDCNTVMAPNVFSGIDTLSLLTFDMSTGLTSWEDAGVVASGAIMYATANTTYLATQQWMNWAIMTEREATDAADGFVTQIHRFDTMGGAPQYVASGEVKGFLLNQFAMDEYLGDLRVASTTSPAGWWTSDESQSRVTVLRATGDTLTPIGVVDGLGLTERIYAVRFMGDLGYVVTFRQTDPLYVLDLSDATAPKVAGELKIPGYSAYLHPVGDGRLLGIGQDADDAGRVKGTQISLFDVSDPASPQRIDQITLEGGWSQAEGNHLAFTYVDGTALAPYERWSWEILQSTGKERSTFDTGVLAIRVEGGDIRLDGILRTELDSEVVLEEPEDWDTVQPYLMVPQRTIVIDGHVYTITQGGIAVHDLASLARLTFQRW